MYLDKSKTVPLDSRSLLVEVAKKIIAEKGYDGTTVKDIAEAAKLNVSLISYYFGGKEGLYKEIVEGFGQAGLEHTRRTLTPVSSLEELRVKLTLWAEHTLEMHAKEHDMTTIVNRDICFKFQKGEISGVMKEVFANTFMKCFLHLMDFIKDGQKKGFLRKDFDSFVAAGMLFSPIIQISTREHMIKEFFKNSTHDPKYRAHMAKNLVDVFILGTTASDAT